MTNQELQNIIERFNEENLKTEAIFGIFQYGGGPDESFIKANKEGFELFALQLLKASRETERILADPSNGSSIVFDYNESWIEEDSDTLVQYLQPVAGRSPMKETSNADLSLADRVIPFGCLVLLILILISSMIGLGTIFNWLF